MKMSNGPSSSRATAVIPPDQKERLRLRFTCRIAFSRTGDPAIGDFGDAKVIRKFGEPEDRSTL